MTFQSEQSGNPSGRPKGIIDTGDNMLQIANDVTAAVACGLMTIEEAEKFTDFLKHQR